MELEFETSRLRKLCEDARRATRSLGAESAKRLQARLADLLAAAKVTELVAGNPHALGGDRIGEYSVRLSGGHRLVFRPSHNPPPTNEDGAIDWAEVVSVRIVFIGDYHD